MGEMERLEIVVKYTGFLKRSDATGLFVSWCPMLDIKCQGRTAEQARRSLDDAVRLFVVHCVKRGILEDALARRGIEPSVEGASDGQELDDDSISVRAVKTNLIEQWDGEVPVPMVASAESARGARSWQQ